MAWTAMRTRVIAACFLCCTAGPTVASADGFRVINTVENFVDLINGRELNRFGITLSVSPDGAIRGRAFGFDVDGAWTWEDGYFCRDLVWGGDDLGYNCQMVQVNGDTLRFTTDRGEGIYADLQLN